MGASTIAFWNHNHWEICDQAIPYFEELEEAGVIHRSASSAADFLNKVYFDIEEWWNSDKVQKPVKRWCEQFAKISSAWAVEWAKNHFRENCKLREISDYRYQS